MPELRRDPVLGRWVIIAVERAKRPSDFGHAEEPSQAEFCPFCEGSESKTPPETLAMGRRGSAPNAPGWQVRVVPNKFPVLRVEGDLGKRGHGVYDVMNGIGAHEVVIETPKHLTTFTSLSDSHVANVLRACKMRLLDLRQDKRLLYAMIFKNVGKAAGASLQHTHTQIILTPVLPRTVMQEMDACRKFFDYRGRCLFCDIVDQESGEERIVMETDDFISFCPYASRFPFETWIVPKVHASHFENIDDRQTGDLAGILKGTLQKIETAIAGGPYNYIIHTSPLNKGDLEHYHWHIEIIPRLTRVAGFEWGTGFYINPVPPENAAGFLRETELPSPEAGR